MYKRRKVFSKIGEKTFSTTEFKTQKEFAAKKEESKKEKVAKAATIGGATIGLGASTAGLGAEIGRKKVKKNIEKAEKELVTVGNGIKARKATSEAIDKLKKNEKKLEKIAKKAPKAALAGVGASVAAGTAYKLARKKKDQKEFSDGKPEQKEFNSKAQKLLRRASDYKKAMTGSGRLVSAGEAGQINKGMNTFGNNGESFIKQGREMNKSLKTRKTDINAKINRKAGLTSAV